MASNLPGLLTWGGPIRSPASKGEDKRLQITGFFDRARVTDQDVHLAVKLLRDNSALHDATIGSRSLFNQGSALFVDLGHPRAL